MKRTTIYLPEALKAALERAADEEKCTEAELVRRGVEHVLAYRTVRPRLPLFESSLPSDYAEHLDEYMAGFGED